MLFFCGLIVGVAICSFIHIMADNNEWKKACIQANLDKCCENAYQYGYESGKFKGWEECMKENFLKYEEMKPNE